MGRKKKKGGQHTTPRRTVQYRADWLAVAEELARRRRKPLSWYLVELIESDARAAGLTDLPAGPWDRPTAAG